MKSSSLVWVNAKDKDGLDYRQALSPFVAFLLLSGSLGKQRGFEKCERKGEERVCGKERRVVKCQECLAFSWEEFDWMTDINIGDCGFLLFYTVKSWNHFVDKIYSLRTNIFKEKG